MNVHYVCTCSYLYPGRFVKAGICRQKANYGVLGGVGSVTQGTHVEISYICAELVIFFIARHSPASRPLTSQPSRVLRQFSPIGTALGYTRMSCTGASVGGYRLWREAL